MPYAAWTSVLGNDVGVEAAVNRIRRVTGTDGREYVLKQPMSWDPAAPRMRLAREFRILSHLRAAGIPVAVPIVADNASICAEQDGELYVLLPRIHFDTGAPEERPDAAEVYRHVGSVIARMDIALAGCPYSSMSYELVPDERIKPETFARLRAADPLLARKLDALTPALRAASAGLPLQLTHGDCHDGNLLLRDGRVVGIIDADHLSTAPRIGDLTRWLGNRMLWAMAAPSQRWAGYVALIEALIQGYDDVASLSSRERAAIGPTLLVTQLDNAEWCLGQGDDTSSYVTGMIRSCHWLADRDAELG